MHNKGSCPDTGRNIRKASTMSSGFRKSLHIVIRRFFEELKGIKEQEAHAKIKACMGENGTQNGSAFPSYPVKPGNSEKENQEEAQHPLSRKYPVPDIVIERRSLHALKIRKKEKYGPQSLVTIY